jgi:acetylornithine deacetylase/succinyl-diaminopimelate desuccinylase-like protein
MSLSVEELKRWYDARQEEILRDFFTFLKFPSISADTHFVKETLSCAEWVCGYLKKIGLDAEVWETSGLPVVFGTYLKAGPKRPTLMIYHHYDVQPVDPLNLWHSDPFQPEVRDGQVFARGALDNKGQCFYSLTALRAVFELASSLNLNLKVFIEGEEESGSSGTAEVLERRKAELKADHLLVVDFDLPAPNTPGITVGMRGMVSFELECSNSLMDLHSGTHGGVALNPNRALAQILSQLWDRSGKVTIPHFYDKVRPLSKEHLAAVDMTFDLDSYTQSFGVHAFCAEEGLSLKESNWLRPTLEINGMWGGYTGSGFKTVIPAKAHAKLSCRIVPDQDPDEIARHLKKHLEDLAPEGIKIKLDYLHGKPAFRSTFDSPIVKSATLAYEEVFGQQCRYLFCGASVPIIVNLAEATGAEVAMIGMGLSDDQIHAPNEHFGLDRFKLGFLTMGRLIERLATS